MHPLHVDQMARIVTEERLERAAQARRAHTFGRPRALRNRVGAGMVAVGTRLQTRSTGRRTAASTAAPC